MDRVEAFYTLAKSYCRYLAENEINYDSIPFLMELLINIYVSLINIYVSALERVHIKRASKIIANMMTEKKLEKQRH